MKRLRIVRAGPWTLSLAALVAFGLYGNGLFEPKPRRMASTPDRTQIGGPFRLTSHKGEVLTDGDFEGRPLAVFFGFTHCPEVCPTALLEMTEILAALGPDADKVTALFVTVDPERDTKQILADYLRAFDPRIVGLTGTIAEVEAAARAYHAYFRKVPIEGGGYTMDHTATTYLMRPGGGMANALDPHEPRETRLLKLRRLIAR